MKKGLTTEQAVVKLKLSTPPLLGLKTISNCNKYGNKNKSAPSKAFLCWYNNEDFVPILEAMQKMSVFYRDKDVDMVKFCCTLPNLANNCLHKSTDANFYPFTEGDKDVLEKTREDVAGGPSIGFTRKAVVDEAFFEKQQTYANLLLGLTLANHTPTRCVNPCRPIFMRVGIWTQNRVDSYLDKTRPAALKIWSCPISNEQDQNVKLKASLQQANRRKFTASVLMGFVLVVKLFEAMGCFYHFCPCRELRPFFFEEVIQRGSKKRELDALRRHYIQEKSFNLIEMWEC